MKLGTLRGTVMSQYFLKKIFQDVTYKWEEVCPLNSLRSEISPDFSPNVCFNNFLMAKFRASLSKSRRDFRFLILQILASTYIYLCLSLYFV